MEKGGQLTVTGITGEALEEKLKLNEERIMKTESKTTEKAAESAVDAVVMATGSTGTSTINQWAEPERVEVNEYHDRIEMIYKQRSLYQFLSFPAPEPEERVFKIVFSCKDGKWHKSDPIYGEIEPATEEMYYFD